MIRPDTGHGLVTKALAAVIVGRAGRTMGRVHKVQRRWLMKRTIFSADCAVAETTRPAEHLVLMTKALAVVALHAKGMTRSTRLLRGAQGTERVQDLPTSVLRKRVVRVVAVMGQGVRVMHPMRRTRLREGAALVPTPMGRWLAQMMRLHMRMMGMAGQGTLMTVRVETLLSAPRPSPSSKTSMPLYKRSSMTSPDG